MSGTSLDGTDIVLCNFELKNNWKFKILKAETIPYTSYWQDKLSNADKMYAYQFIKLHKEYGCYLGELVKNFINSSGKKVDFIASHGHTVFHNPDEKITFQIGDGSSIAAITKITTISDFRSLDVALNGQGAPLVPIGDEMLFNNYDFCLNLGGFANISFNKNNKRFAFDICPINIIINHYTRQINLDLDRNGEIAYSGKLNAKLFEELNNLSFYKLNYPKSLGKEWLISEFIPVVDKYDLKIEDKLRTIYEHIAYQINKAIICENKKSVLTTGGGAYNNFLIDTIKQKNKKCEFIIPAKNIIDFKEAIIFAFLGILRYKNEVNCLSSVTGATKDNIGGIIFQI